MDKRKREEDQSVPTLTSGDGREYGARSWGLGLGLLSHSVSNHRSVELETLEETQGPTDTEILYLAPSTFLLFSVRGLFSGSMSSCFGDGPRCGRLFVLFAGSYGIVKM